MTPPEWVVLQLNSRGEQEDLDILHAWFQRQLRGIEIFIPATVSQNGDSRVVHRLVEGYVFARRSAPDHLYFRLEDSRYVEFVLTANHRAGGQLRRQLACVKDPDVDRMRNQAYIEAEQGITVGDEVQVTSGAYKGINGEVIEELPENDSVQVYIKLRSKQAIVTLPRSFLKFVSRNSDSDPVFSPFATKIARVRDWVDKASPILLWRPPLVEPLLEARDRFVRLETWRNAGDSHVRFLRSMGPSGISALPPKLESVREARDRTVHLARWCERGGYLFLASRADVCFHRLPDLLTRLTSSRKDVGFLDLALLRVRNLEVAARKLERALAQLPETMENVVIDGMNLAMRVHHALSGGKFQDAQGRPTETIYGFLKNLSVFRKRFPTAKIHIAWEGSSARRRAVCSEYKANRPAPSPSVEGAFDQVAALKTLLPLLGVVQVHNPAEEADDVIGALVRGPLVGKRNVIVSTDHDFLQLVTLTDILLVPKVANRAEVVYDGDKVVEHYGVEASKMPELRALLGDSSDNLKGISRVPGKVLTALLQAHSSIDGIYASGLAGLTPNQYTRVREAEAQVRQNVQLMTLDTSISFLTVDPSPDEVAARALLEEFAIRPDPLLTPFFRSDSDGQGFFKTNP